MCSIKKKHKSFHLGLSSSKNAYADYVMLSLNKILHRTIMSLNCKFFLIIIIYHPLLALMLNSAAFISVKKI